MLERGLCSPKFQERSIERENSGMGRLQALAPHQTAVLKRGRGLRIGNAHPDDGIGEPVESRKLLSSAYRDEPAQVHVMVGKELKAAAGGPFLAHEQQGCLGKEQQQRTQRAVERSIDLMVEPAAERAVSDLIVVLEAEDHPVEGN